jgi:hypothetical protein
MSSAQPNAPAGDQRPRRQRMGFAAISVEDVITSNAIAVVRSERGRGIGHYLMLGAGHQ